MKKLILFLFFILLSPLIVNADADMYQDAYIQSNGDLLVKEAISLYGDYNGFELDLTYKYTDKNAIYSADSLELKRVCEAPANGFSLFNNVGTCFEQVPSANTGDSGVYVYNNYDGYATIRMYNPSGTTRKSFYVEYTLKNVVVKHNDTAELRLNVLDNSFGENLRNFEMKVHLPNKDTNMRIWAHGPLYGNSKIENNDTGVFTVTDLPSNTMVDIRMAFNKDLIPDSTKLSNKDNLNNIISEETKLANQANKEREQAQTRDTIKYVAIAVFSLLWIIGLIIIWIHTYKKYDKEYKSDFNEKYFRDFPSNDSPETIEYLMDKKVDSTGLSSSLLNIIRKKGLTVEETKKEKGIIFKKEEKDYTLKIGNEVKEPLTENETKLREWLLNDYGDGEKFELSSLKEKITNLSKAQKFMEGYNDWISKAKSAAIEQEFYEDNTSKKILPVLYGLLPFVSIFLGNLSGFILIIPSIIFIVYIVAFSKRTKKGNDLYTRWNALKSFLSDFGNFKDKELPEVFLWEKYLVYANVFGLADKLRKEMEIKIKNIPNADVTTFNTFNYLYLNYAINQSIHSSINSAITTANSRIAASQRSSGGGFGGGWSGGGGFGGGGGSGGGRF